MSETTGLCQYVLDPDDPNTWEGDASDDWNPGYWECPFDAVDYHDGDKKCAFHIDNKSKNSDARDKLINIITDSDADKHPEQITIYNGSFDGIKIDELTPITGERLELNLSYSEFYGDIDIKDADLSNWTLNFNGCRFDGDLLLPACDLDHIFLNDLNVSGEMHLIDASVNTIEIRESTFFDRVYFNESEIRKLRLRESKFRGDWTSFRNTGFKDRVSLSNVTFDGDSSLCADYSDTSDVELNNVEATNSKLSNCDLSKAKITESNFSGSNMNGVRMNQTNLESTILSRSTFFGADLRGAKIHGTILGDIRVNNRTQYLGSPSDNSDISPHSVSAIHSRQTCIYDPDFKQNNENADKNKAKSVYRTLEELGRKHARPRLQARSFVRRQDLQKNEYKQNAKEAESWEERLIAGARWSRAKVARVTLLYGESPWRVIAWSLGIIFFFALLYPLGGWIEPRNGNPITYAQIMSNPTEILNSVYYSTLTYTALGFGDFQPVGWGRLWTTLETGLGAIMLALLVFILGRRASR